jgi:hypothetical protein
MNRRGPLVVALVVLARIVAAYAHDHKQPGLDAWYAGLKRDGDGFPCCNITDCHRTEAEIRDDRWWARIGKPLGDGEWELGEWRPVPEETILKGKTNMAGEPVICHGLDRTIYCFVEPNLS